MNELASHDNEYPPQVDLREMFNKHPVPVIAPGTVDPASMAGDEATKQALAVVDALNSTLVAEDAKSLEDLQRSRCGCCGPPRGQKAQRNRESHPTRRGSAVHSS